MQCLDKVPPELLLPAARLMIADECTAGVEICLDVLNAAKLEVLLNKAARWMRKSWTLCGPNSQSESPPGDGGRQ